ncbi:MAG TPA: hypothetical protein PLW65_03260 [Pseudomonadota bacterium]|nr:hypothetical protein [Pseudomonadota bacterium]
MKTLRNVVAALLFCSLSVSATAQAKRHHQAPVAVTALTAADTNHRLQLIEQSLLDDGFVLADTQEQPIYYLLAPAAPYAWGSLVYTYVRTVPGRANQRVEVSAEVQNTTDGYNFPHITIRDLPAQ